ncbi:MAG: DUF6529 family protein [Ilumatobacter sp.]
MHPANDSTVTTTHTGTETDTDTTGTAGEPAERSGGIRTLLIAAAIGGAVSLSLGAYGRIHTPTGQGIVTFGFPAVLPMKAWLGTGAATLAIGQLLSALWMWGRLPFAGPAGAGVALAHRWLGTAAFVLTLPIAYHCLWALGFQDTTTRVLVHSILGCAFYGAFTTKMLVLHSKRVPSWTLPVLGGLLVAILTGIWYTSSLWYFDNFGFPGV